MDNEIKLAKKRGPKPSGVRKEVLFMRVPEGWRDRLKEACKGVLSGKEAYVCFDGWNKQANKDVGFLGYAAPEKKAVDNPASGVNSEVVELKRFNLQLAEETEGLRDQVRALEIELEECRLMTYDDKMGYWKARALKAEAYAASKNE